MKQRARPADARVMADWGLRVLAVEGQETNWTVAE